jgi:hypothetical protein
MDSFTHRGFLNNAVYAMQMDGTDIDVLWDDSEEVGNVWSECEVGEGTNCEHGDSDTGG